MSPHRREIHLDQRPTTLEPFKILITFMCVAAGIGLVLQGAAPETVEDTLPDWLVFVWGAELIIGGVLVLVGSFRGSWFLERNGLALLGAAAAVYGLVLIVAAWPAAVLVAAITLGFAAACFVSIWLARRVPLVIRVRKRGAGDAP